MSRWTAEAHRLATLDRSIDSIATALRAAYEAGRAEQREADAKVCQCCAAAIRAQDPRRELARASAVRFDHCEEQAGTGATRECPECGGSGVKNG